MSSLSVLRKLSRCGGRTYNEVVLVMCSKDQSEDCDLLRIQAHHRNIENVVEMCVFFDKWTIYQVTFTEFGKINLSKVSFCLSFSHKTTHWQSKVIMKGH